MSYAILEEHGETRKIYFTKISNFGLAIKVARPQFLLEDMKPFYFYFVEKDPEHGWMLKANEKGFNDFGDFKEKLENLGEEAVKSGMPRSVVDYLVKDVKENLKTLGDPEYYFDETDSPERKKQKENLKRLYELTPGTTWPEKNKNLLTKIARKSGLPTELPSFMPNYTSLDRPLEPEEVLDDIENRKSLGYVMDERIEEAKKNPPDFIWGIDEKE